YRAKSGKLTFRPGQTSQKITVSVLGDRKVEPDETFFVNLSGASSNALIVDSQGVGTILNDDSAAGASGARPNIRGTDAAVRLAVVPKPTTNVVSTPNTPAASNTPRPLSSTMVDRFFSTLLGEKPTAVSFQAKH